MGFLILLNVCFDKCFIYSYLKRLSFKIYYIRSYKILKIENI